MSLIKHHPSLDWLNKFAIGDVDDQTAILIAAHIFSCTHCQEQLSLCESQFSENQFSGQTTHQSALNQAWMDQTFNSIIQAPVHPDESDFSQNSTTEIVVDEKKQVQLIEPLAKLKGRMKRWIRGPGDFSICPLDVDGEGKLFFVHFSKGSQVPEHTHSGSELSLVVSGSFSDGERTFHTGDFAEFKDDLCHSPLTEDENGCLIVTKLDGPFKFKNGLSRLILNPLQKLFF